MGRITAASDVSGSIIYTAEALLLLAQQQDLAAHLLGLQQQLMAASKRLREMANALGSASQAGAAAMRKCDLLETVIAGLVGNTVTA